MHKQEIHLFLCIQDQYGMQYDEFGWSDIEQMAHWMCLRKDAISEYMKGAVGSMPVGYDGYDNVQELLFEVLDRQWDECFFQWQKFHYFRNNKNKQMEILHNLIFQEIELRESIKKWPVYKK